ncbi:MAG: dihydroorotate dehydrogenase-like protein [Anaerolineae bacterium]|nr:dihydroorotate dehydrogenase-like protein [Anaerolineae bacterium]
MDLSTVYLGLTLKNPLVVSASPLSEDISSLRRMEDAGAGAIVLYSLFEEQLRREQIDLHHHTTYGTNSFAEALTYFPEPEEYKVGPDGYLEHIRKAKAAVDIPVIASINGSTPGGWTNFALAMQAAGADALELNVYNIPTDLDMSGEMVEQNLIEIVRAVRNTVSIPIAVKLSPFYSNMANLAKKLAGAGANGLVLFNRFYQPDIDLEALEVRPHVLLSTPAAMRLPLRWIAILHGRVPVDLAGTSGIHKAEDVIKMLMVGANVTMMAATLMRNGIDYLRTVEAEVRFWLQDHEYDSVRQMIGSLSQKNSGNPAAFERANYIRSISTIPDEYARSYRL